MSLKYLILDVDGTLTDGGIYYDESNNEFKKFCTKDGTGIIIARTVGITPIVLTGRSCNATTRRMQELCVTNLFQNVKNKAEWLRKWMQDNGVHKEEIGYIGDDVNDLAPMQLCSFIACPADASDEVKAIADYVSTIDGGYGVVRDVIRYILVSTGGEQLWQSALDDAYNMGV